MKKIMVLVAIGVMAVLSACSAASSAKDIVAGASDCDVSSTENSATASTKGGSVTFTQTENGYSITYGGALSFLESRNVDVKVGKDELLDMAKKYCAENE